MTNFTWTVTNLYTQTIDGKEDYVVIANYETIGVDGVYSSSLQNTAQFSTEDVSVFIPYADLTEEIVIGWIKETLGENGIISIEACINGQIESQKNPPSYPVNTPLPW
ncbi:MAG: hypothetical protein ACOVOV_05515 [Dolichospermum sp.]|jgi:hypothetical protein